MKFFTLLAFFTYSVSFAQNSDILSWINSNAIIIEDANPDTPLTAFSQNVPQKFKDARIFGFGEASHHGKEFFDIKAKFFKYLVEQQGVTVFIMEDTYIDSYRVNTWLSGGNEGDARKMAGSLGFTLWHTEEVARLLQWMKDYNLGREKNKQIRFYGMDDQSGIGINQLVRTYVKQENLKVPEALLAVADSCASKPILSAPAKEWSADNVAKLKEMRVMIAGKVMNDKTGNEQILHAIDVLIQYTNFISNPNQQLRDNDMFDNVNWIMAYEGENSKAFVWAHNDHINKKALGALKDTSIGRRLKDFYENAYYSVGFDFGKGRLYGLTYTGKQRKPQAVTYNLEKPYKNTYAEVLIKAQAEVFFVDMDDAEKAPVAAKFFSSNKKQLSAASGGYNPKYPYIIKRDYSETFDGIIFVKNISVPLYIKEATPAIYYVE